MLRALGRRWRFGLLAVAALGVAAPVALLAHGTARARACVAAYAAPRGPALPDCRREIRWFVVPSRIPWTAMPARYRAEELAMRAAVADYDDAAVGRPDGAREVRAAGDLALAEELIHHGSQRVALEELGRGVGAPEPGRAALLAGDRRTLLARGNLWGHWSVHLRTLEAALLEGDAARATALARSYAEGNPTDDDLRVAIAALLCLGGDPVRGGDILTAVQNERAQNRHEAWSRNWGEVRALIVACAGKARRAPPPAPDRGDAGSGDQIEARAVLRLQQVTESDPGDSPARSAAGRDVVAVLKGGPLAPGGRVRVLAALLASGYPVDAELAAALAAPRLGDGEAPLLPASPSLTAIDWLDSPRGVRPAPSRHALRHAADLLRRLAASPEASADERLVLETVTAATALEAARAFALAGEGAGAVEILDRLGALALPGAAARALARSTAWYVAADPARGLAEVEREAVEMGASLRAAPSSAPKPPGDLGEGSAVRVAWWIQKAELLASAGRRDEAARAAILADEAATTLGDRGLAARAAWTRVAFAPQSPLRSEPPPPLPGARSWPWVGELAAPASRLAPEAESPIALARALAFWGAARRAAPEEKRALRYAAFAAHRGDAPRAGSVYLALAGALLPEGDGDVEVWLDAFSATAAREGTLRAQAWARAEAARFRGDTAAASRWSESYRTLARIAAAAGDAELAAALGI